MSITHENGNDLNTYYANNPPSDPPCEDCDDTIWWGLTPYDWRETLNYFFKMLVLPGAIAAVIILLMILTTGSIDNLTLWTIIIVLTYIGSILIALYARHRLLTWIHRIQDENSLIIPDPLNQINNTTYKIGFVGDIMRMRIYGLQFSNEVINFFSGVDIIVGNLEGIIRPDDPPMTKQSHPATILQQLNGLLRGGTNWLLCLSNNHSIDFGNREFHRSLNDIQQEPRIDVFGRYDVSHVYVRGQNINISCATEWSNQRRWDCISRFPDSMNSSHIDTRLNILYPHWNYENERYVRRWLQNRANDLLTSNVGKRWDLIFGHHPHVRQPVIYVHDTNDNVNKLVAFSGGNFTSGVRFFRLKKHIHGIIMRCDIGPLTQNPARLGIGKVEIQNTYNKKGRDPITGDRIKTVVFGEGIQGISRFWILIIGIVIITTVVLLRVFGIF
ncbi:MAG: CapA family protein [Candidatus Hodarchaeota archaeon]